MLFRSFPVTIRSSKILRSYLLKTFLREEIMSYLERNLGCYPATGELKFYRPSNYYAWGLLSKRKWTGIFFPLYFINFLVAIHKSPQSTSSKLIYLSELFSMKDLSPCSSFMWKLFKKQMKKQYGTNWVKGLFDIYFHTEDADHPLRFLPNLIDCDKL